MSNDKKLIKGSIDKLVPTEKQSNKMWERLLESVSDKEISDIPKTENNVIDMGIIKEKKYKNKNKVIKNILAVAASVIFIIVAGIGVDNATGGKVKATIKEWIDIFQGNQDVAGNIVENTERNNSVYAPDILYIDDSMVIFADLRGVVLYDLEKSCLMATIDTQKIDCVYFESDNKKSHIIKEDNQIIVFNSDNGVPVGSYYIYDVEHADGGELSLLDMGDDEVKLEKYYKQWKCIEENCEYTTDVFADNEQAMELFSIDADNIWSEQSVSWIDATGKKCSSFILVSDKNMYIYTSVEGNDSFIYTTLDMTSENNSQEDTGVYLSQFIYTGDDKKIEAIYEYMKGEYSQFLEENQISIPGYVIYKTVETDEEILVFGNFWVYGYQLTGNILEAQSGNEMPACFCLKRNGNNYQVVSVERAEDGSYMEDIQNFTKDYPEVYDQIMAMDNDERIEAMRCYIEMYVTDNNLNIEYFSEYASDPIKIFD